MILEPSCAIAVLIGTKKAIANRTAARSKEEPAQRREGFWKDGPRYSVDINSCTSKYGCSYIQTEARRHLAQTTIDNETSTGKPLNPATACTGLAKGIRDRFLAK